jgi:hypothetical protein
MFIATIWLLVSFFLGLQFPFILRPSNGVAVLLIFASGKEAYEGWKRWRNRNQSGETGLPGDEF